MPQAPRRVHSRPPDGCVAHVDRLNIVKCLARRAKTWIIAPMQLELFPWDSLSDADRDHVFKDIRRSYWHLRNLRSGRFGQADQRRYYRIVAAQKKRLLMAGVDKREILDFLRCCRLQCTSHQPPFKACPYCS